MSNAELIARVQRARTCIYIAVEEKVADDINAIFKDCIDAIVAADKHCQQIHDEAHQIHSGTGTVIADLRARIEAADRLSAVLLGALKSALADLQYFSMREGGEDRFASIHKVRAAITLAEKKS